MSEKYKLKNAAFLSAVYVHDAEDVNFIESLLEVSPEMSEWEEIGYKYIALLTMREHADTFIKSHPWIYAILQGIDEPINGVKGQVEEGIRYSRAKIAEQKFRFNAERVADAVAGYLEEWISPYDLDLFQSLLCKDQNGEYFPINRKGTWNIGVINPWPGSMSAEAEVLARMKVSADDAGVQLTMLSNFGHILEADTQKQTKEYVDAHDLDFALSTHYDTHKSVDTFYYHTLWNPPEIPLNLDDYSGRVTDNYLMNDDYLIYDAGGMSHHLQCILLNSERNLEGASSLTASFPQKSMLKPRLDDPKMFYCGMNWERVVNNSNRHEGLFKLLDQTGKVKFFGPEKVEAWGGIRPWEGYKCYQYSIPFDGFSILEEINKCGICLVLSSDIHRRAGAATNRTYEACAAGAVIISDDNPFMLEHFKDAALFIQYNKNNPQDTFNQLMEKYQWIVEHRQEALQLAERAQQIFCQKFAMDKQVKDLVKNHPTRLGQVKEKLYAKDDTKVVLSTFVINTQNTDEAFKLLEPVFSNIRNQYYRSIQLAIAVDESIAKEVEEHCRKELYTVQIKALPLFDFKGSRQMTDAEALDILYQTTPHSYFINMRSEEVWFRDHITTLVRAIEDSGAVFSYSGRLFEDSAGYRRTDMFGKFAASTIYLMDCPNWMPMPGQILFTNECHEYLPKYMLPFLDGMEHYALMDLLTFRLKKESTFSRRMTFNYVDGKWDERYSVVPMVMQIRLIRDAVKYCISDNSLIQTSSSVVTTDVMRTLTLIPIKKWLSVRIMRILLRILPSHSGLYKKISIHYEEKANEFIRYLS